MVKLVYCFARKADLSFEEFSRYWRDVHAPIGRRIPGIRRFVQSVAIRDGRDAREPGFDGMVELWFDDVEAVLRARESPEWAASTADELQFIDYTRTAYFLSHERMIVNRQGDDSNTEEAELGTNAAIVRRWFRDVWVEGGEKTVDELLAPDVVGWMESRVVNGAQDFKDARRELLQIFPDLVISVEDVVEEGNKAAVRWSVQATHRGEGLGMPPTNRRVSFRGMTWVELRDGKIVRGWDCWNQGGLILSLIQPETSNSPAGPDPLD